MGAPNGPNGNALRVAERLKALVEHFFFTRLAKSYLIIEIAIPFHKLDAPSYFEKYMERIRGVMVHNKIRHRLTVILDPVSAQQYVDCDPKQFYPPDVDQGRVWLQKASDFRFIWTFVNHNQIGVMPHGWIPSREQLAKAREQWLKSQILNEADRRRDIDQAIAKV